MKKPESVKIDDQFAKNLGAKGLNDLKELITKQIQNQYKTSLDDLSKDRILNQIEKLHDIDLPNSLIQQELELLFKGLKKEDAERRMQNEERGAEDGQQAHGRPWRAIVGQPCLALVFKGFHLQRLHRQ